MGFPLTWSLSKAFHEENLRRKNLNWEFRVLEWDETTFASEIHVLKKDPTCVGFSVTMPYKQKIFSYIDRCDEFSKVTGVVNCVSVRDGRWFGFNTDGLGFMEGFRQWNPLPPKDVKIIFLGCGATARSLSWALFLEGYRNFLFVNRDLGKAKVWLNVIPSSSVIPRAELKGSHLFILNTLPLEATTSLLSWIQFEKLSSPTWIFDVLYNPSETELIRQARSQCFYTMNGRPMFEAQGQLAFDIWLQKKTQGYTCHATGDFSRDLRMI